MSESTASFVVKAITRDGQPLWISRPSLDGIRTLVPKESADVFATRAEAYAVIGKMPRVFQGHGYLFTVQYFTKLPTVPMPMT